jgi:transcriptional regulator with XRE-family HTH domain
MPTTVMTLGELKKELFTSHPSVARHYEAAKRAGAFKVGAHRLLGELRHTAKLTQATVAERMGVSQPVVSRLEKDEEADLTLESLFRFAEACGVQLVLGCRPFDESEEASSQESRSLQIRGLDTEMLREAETRLHEAMTLLQNVRGV